jgi:hypothetical protein
LSRGSLTLHLKRLILGDERSFCRSGFRLLLSCRHTSDSLPERKSTSNHSRYDF